MISGFPGRHSETGTIVNALAKGGIVDPHTGRPYSEALAFGASGGIAFGYFVFEYKGHLPHVALLARNTFSPFERALDNLAIRREVRETVHAEKGENNLRFELDAGNPTIVWADVFSMPYRGLCRDQMWAMQPMVVVGQEGGDFLLADGSEKAVRLSAEELGHARGRVKKDRFRMAVLEPPDAERVAEGLQRGIETCVALFLDKPPAGSANNFGIAGMRHLSTMLRDEKNAKSWTRTFAPGPRLAQALAGTHGQPGVWDWIETWGTAAGADRGTYAQFLREASIWMSEKRLIDVAEQFDQARPLWQRLAEESMPDAVPEFKTLKELKRRHKALWVAKGRESDDERAVIRREMKELTASVSAEERLQPHAKGIMERMAQTLDEIVEVEERAVGQLRAALDG